MLSEKYRQDNPVHMINCNLCQHRTFDHVWTIPSTLLKSEWEILRTPEQFHVDKCCSCGLMQVRETPLLSDEYMTALYDAEYFENYGGHAYEQYLRRRPFRRLANILKDHSDSTTTALLEIGCAYGGFLEECTALGWRAEGIDLSKSAVDIAAGRGLNVHCGDFRTAELDRQHYDAVVSLATIEHVLDPKQFLIDSAKLVRPGGLFMFTTIEMSGLMPRLLGRRWAQVGPPYHLYYFRQAQLVQYMENAGLTPLWVGGKMIPGTFLYRITPYRPGHSVLNVGYVLFIGRRAA